MIQTYFGIVRSGRIEPLEQTPLPEGAWVLVTVLPAEETEHWLVASQQSLNQVWDNQEDDIYGELLST